jgi:hypothetical protein
MPVSSTASHTAGRDRAGGLLERRPDLGRELARVRMLLSFERPARLAAPRFAERRVPVPADRLSADLENCTANITSRYATRRR